MLSSLNYRAALPGQGHPFARAETRARLSSAARYVLGIDDV